MKQEEQAKKMQKIIAKAWVDEAFKQKLLSNSAETLRQEGLEVPRQLEVCVHENTDKVVHVVLPLRPAYETAGVETVERREAAEYVCWLCGCSGCVSHCS